MDVVGVYLDRLIALRGLKVKAVHEQAGVKPGYISRIISRDIKEPSTTIVKALTTATGGSWDDVGTLLTMDATPELATSLADAWYKKITRMGVKPFFRCPVELIMDSSGAVMMRVTLRNGDVRDLPAPPNVQDTKAQVFAFQREGSDSAEFLWPKSDL